MLGGYETRSRCTWGIVWEILITFNIVQVVKWSLSGNAIPTSSFGPVPQVLKNISAEQEEENEEEEVKEHKNEGTENDEIQKLSEVDTAMQDVTDLAAQVEEKLDCGLENPVDLPEMSAWVPINSNFCFC